MASAAPLRICRPSRLTPLMRVWALKGMNVAWSSCTLRPRSPYLVFARTTMLRPSGVSSASEANWAASAKRGNGDAFGRQELDGLAIAQRDGAGFVQQQHVHVAGGLDRPARHGDHVGLDHPIHAGDADGGKQPADGRGNQADQQGHEHRDRDGRAAGSPMPGGSTLNSENGSSVTQTSRKMIVMPASRMSRAISLGVFWRLAPSTMAIMRSKKVSPGLAVTRTTSQSDRTRVPPVTLLRSPPLSRITGALSPVMALSSTEAMPSITSPSTGM